MRLLRAKEKKERALGTRLMLKAYRSMSGKSAMTRRPYRPGVHGKNRSIASEYKLQLMEKQKIKLTYGLNERQMKNLVKKAIASGKPIPDYIISNLESRLDNVVYRMGIAPSRIVARQLVSHGHFYVNKRKVTVASYKLKVGDVVLVKESSRGNQFVKESISSVKNFQMPSWLVFDADRFEGTTKSKPENIECPFNIGLIIDYYSR